jgi:glutamine cyclotransferase
MKTKHSINSFLSFIKVFLILKSYFIFPTFTCNNKIKINTEMSLSHKDFTSPPPLIETANYIVEEAIPRQEKIFYTQGIFFDDENNLIESGGLYGESVLIKMQFPQLKEIKSQKLDKRFFGEGTAKCGKFIYQLTWLEKSVLKYKSDTFERVDQNNLFMDSKIDQGWGLTESEDGNLYESDGTDNIYKLSCDDLKIISTIKVKLDGRPIDRINALAFANGFIYANVYYMNVILKINPQNGKVMHVYNLKPVVDWELNNGRLTASNLQSGDVLNGIAYNKSDPNNPFFLITGKKWGHYFIVKFK